MKMEKNKNEQKEKEIEQRIRLYKQTLEIWRKLA